MKAVRREQVAFARCLIVFDLLVEELALLDLSTVAIRLHVDDIPMQISQSRSSSINRHLPRKVNARIIAFKVFTPLLSAEHQTLRDALREAVPSVKSDITQFASETVERLQHFQLPRLKDLVGEALNGI